MKQKNKEKYIYLSGLDSIDEDLKLYKKITS
jgi:hypothetical protein